METWEVYSDYSTYTAHIDTENKQECINAGMDVVLSKPLSYDTAKDIISAFVPKHEFVEKRKRTAKNKKGVDNLLNIKGDVIDLSIGMEKVNCDVRKAKKMIDIMVDEFKKDIPHLVNAKNNNDWSSITNIVHKHRGGSLYCGVPRFQEACTRLEVYLIQNKKGLREKLYEQLLDEFDKVCKEQIKNVK